MNENPAHESRDRKRTERRILDAARILIEEQGFHGAGVNAIAEKAGINKVLLYRYFGGLDGLYQALASDLDLAKLRYAEELLSDLKPTGDLESRLAARFRMFRERLRSDEFSQALMIWELCEQNELTRAFAAAREKIGTEVSAALQRRIGGGGTGAVEGDLEAALAIASAAIYYLILREREVRFFNGIDIRSEEGWSRLCDAMASMIAGLVKVKAPAEKNRRRAQTQGRD